MVDESGSLSAAYHLARHLEAVGQIADAVSFYARSNRYNHAIRLAKEHGMDSEVRSPAGTLPAASESASSDCGYGPLFRERHRVQHRGDAPYGEVDIDMRDLGLLPRVM